MSDRIINITADNFEELVLRSEKPVLVDFWAPWCGPCKMMAPTLDRLADEREDMVIAKINVDEVGDISAKYGVRGIPTLMLFKQGEVDRTKVGALSGEQLKRFLA
ncbi:thioredoxin [Pseudomonas fluorescens]|uniref:thioredoxin n=1 Tax=Pseudomonas TaxID=286 RepID=UPI000F01A7DC|nr:MULTISPECIES: thioredoxin [Pseudomonas]MBD8088991.1 thioredoxin [Pseudomonas fluorescens]MBD8615578.1 thioredoxin [Pseudomonas putida]MBD8681770.1 thioredoxin [Pseudomonas sp. CFBP 13719]